MSRIPALVLAALLASAARADEPAELLERGKGLNEKGQYPEAQWVLRDLITRFPASPEAGEARELTAPNRFLRVRTLHRGGASTNRVDLFILGEGYRFDRQGQFDDAARFVLRRLFQSKVLAEYRAYFNVHQMNIASREDGVTTPKRREDTALGAYVTNLAQRHVAVERSKVLEFLRKAPESEGLAIVVVKNGTLGTGGGGIAAVGGKAEGAVLHEWGHAFAGLADEYNTDVGEPGVNESAAPGPNVSFTRDPRLVPWRHWLEARAGAVGVFLGAAGRATGAWKPVGGGCVMENGADFCVVCREAVVLAIHQRVRLIDAFSPEAAPPSLDREETHEFWVEPLRPASHAVKVEWHLHRFRGGEEEQGEDPPAPRPGGGRAGRRERLPVRGERLPWEAGVGPMAGRAVVRLRGRDLKPGAYELTAVVWDPTPIDNHLPWVLSDPGHLLEARAVWRFEVPGAGGAGG